MSKFIASFLVSGGQVFARAFASAYRQAAANAARGGSQASEQAGETAKKASQRLKGVMEVEEAYKILDAKATADVDGLLERCDHLYKITDKENGGSLYLQSKIYRAREAIVLEREMTLKSASSDAANTSSNTPPPPPSSSSSSSNSTDPQDKGS
eukprot:m.17702 g.17702  ORF g.17702 m.17702 type:complete len:154 (-) comp11639_c0_seq1:801-1262(-)